LGWIVTFMGYADYGCLVFHGMIRSAVGQVSFFFFLGTLGLRIKNGLIEIVLDGMKIFFFVLFFYKGRLLVERNKVKRQRDKEHGRKEIQEDP
jgi:hypothetical protein